VSTVAVRVGSRALEGSSVDIGSSPVSTITPYPRINARPLVLIQDCSPDYRSFSPFHRRTIEGETLSAPSRNFIGDAGAVAVHSSLTHVSRRRCPTGTSCYPALGRQRRFILSAVPAQKNSGLRTGDHFHERRANSISTKSRQEGAQTPFPVATQAQVRTGMGMLSPAVTAVEGWYTDNISSRCTLQLRLCRFWFQLTIRYAKNCQPYHVPNNVPQILTERQCPRKNSIRSHRCR